MTDILETLRYPIGRFQFPAEVTDQQVEGWIAEIGDLPAVVRRLITPLSPSQLAMVYRPGGWSVAQVVHHLADSHLNAFARCKLALTEDRPTIKPYREDRWAETPDARGIDVAPSLDLLAGLHARWATLLRGLRPGERKRKYVHPESGDWTLERVIAMYAWHGRHHLAQVTRLAEREGW